MTAHTPLACDVQVGDVIQINPDRCAWGPVLCIVDHVNPKSVRCFFFTEHTRFEPPEEAYMRVPHSDYVRIGRASWLPSSMKDLRELADVIRR